MKNYMKHQMTRTMMIQEKAYNIEKDLPKNNIEVYFNDRNMLKQVLTSDEAKVQIDLPRKEWEALDKYINFSDRLFCENNPKFSPFKMKVTLEPNLVDALSWMLALGEGFPEEEDDDV